MRKEPGKLEPPMTEITIAPDGRVFFFGLCGPVLEIAASLNPRDAQIERRLERFRQLPMAESGLAQPGDES